MNSNYDFLILVNEDLILFYQLFNKSILFKSDNHLSQFKLKAKFSLKVLSIHFCLSVKINLKKKLTN